MSLIKAIIFSCNSLNTIPTSIPYHHLFQMNIINEGYEKLLSLDGQLQTSNGTLQSILDKITLLETRVDELSTGLSRNSMPTFGSLVAHTLLQTLSFRMERIQTSLDRLNRQTTEGQHEWAEEGPLTEGVKCDAELKRMIQEISEKVDSAFEQSGEIRHPGRAGKRLLAAYSKIKGDVEYVKNTVQDLVSDDQGQIQGGMSLRRRRRLSGLDQVKETLEDVEEKIIQLSVQQNRNINENERILRRIDRKVNKINEDDDDLEKLIKKKMTKIEKLLKDLDEKDDDDDTKEDSHDDSDDDDDDTRESRRKNSDDSDDSDDDDDDTRESRKKNSDDSDDSDDDDDTKERKSKKNRHDDDDDDDSDEDDSDDDDTKERKSKKNRHDDDDDDGSDDDDDSNDTKERRSKKNNDFDDSDDSDDDDTKERKSRRNKMDSDSDEDDTKERKSKKDDNDDSDDDDDDDDDDDNHGNGRKGHKRHTEKPIIETPIMNQQTTDAGQQPASETASLSDAVSALFGYHQGHEMQ